MVTELILAGNGPGELAGWMAPVARAARAAAPDVRLTLALTPSQFASGREAEVARRWSLFDRIVDVGTTAAAALGTTTFEPLGEAAVVHLGGDLWFSARLARRMRVPAAAIAETTLIASRHRPFALVFAVSEDLADDLRRRGVPREKLVVTGDPRRDALPAPDGRAAQADGAGLVTLLPGSRDAVFALVAPDLLEVAAALRARLPGIRFQVVTSEFLSPAVVERVRETVRRRWPGLDVAWQRSGAWNAVAAGDFALTIPGTNTLELAMLGVPFAVVVDLAWVDRAPLEGSLEWLARVPVLGPRLRRAVVGRHLARGRPVALPNIRAGRPLVPEWVGRWSPEELARRVEDALRDEAGREALRAELRRLFAGSGGAARRIADAALRLARRR